MPALSTCCAMCAVIWKDESLGAEFEDRPIPAELAEKAAQYRQDLIETAVEMDDEAMEAYLDGDEPSIATLKQLHPQGRHQHGLRPGAVRLGLQEQGRAAAARRGGRLPAGAGRHSGDQGHQGRHRRSRSSKHATDDEPFAGLAFKIMNDPFVGSLTFVRVYSGIVESGSYVQNTVKDKRERVGRMLLMHANSREEIKEARAGDIVAFAGLKDTTHRRHPVRIQRRSR